MLRRRPWLGAMLLASAWLCCSLFFLVSVAAAETPPPYEPPAPVSEPEGEPLAECPGGVEPYEGEDPAAFELRLLRGEVAEACAVLSELAAQNLERSWWLVLEAVAAREQRVVTNTLLAEVKDRLEAPVQVEAVDAGASAEQAAEVVSAVDAAGAATREAVWFLIGLAVALYAAYALYRQVMPRG